MGENQRQDDDTGKLVYGDIHTNLMQKLKSFSLEEWNEFSDLSSQLLNPPID